MKEVVSRHRFNIGPGFGGESLFLETEFIKNGDPIDEKNGIFINQTLTLQSYCNSASFFLTSAALTPKMLRELADELEQARKLIAPSGNDHETSDH